MLCCDFSVQLFCVEPCRKQNNILNYSNITDIKKELGDERDIIYNGFFDFDHNLSKFWCIILDKNSANKTDNMWIGER